MPPVGISISTVGGSVCSAPPRILEMQVFSQDHLGPVIVSVQQFAQSLHFAGYQQQTEVIN